MNFMITFLLTISGVVLTTSQRPVMNLEPQWSTVSTINGLMIGASAKKDLLVYPDFSDSSAPVITIRRRSAYGVFITVANFTEEVRPYTPTNGRWIAMMEADGPTTAVTLFTINENDEISNASTISSTRGGFLLSDDTFVGFDPETNNDGNFTIRTYEYNATDNTWINIPGTELVIRTSVLFVGDASTYRATDTHLVVLDTFDPLNYTINIYERQADRSWKLIDSVPVNSAVDDIPASTYFNGETLVFARCGAVLGNTTYGIIHIYTNTSNGWTLQTFNLLDLGYHPIGFLGGTVIFIDANTLLVSVAFDGYNGQKVSEVNGGKVLLLTRENGVWKDSLDFSGVKGIFGAGITANDHEIIFSSLTSQNGRSLGVSFYVLPICFVKPINVTCQDQQLDSCSAVTTAKLYNINDSPQCGRVTASLDSLSLINNQQLAAQFSFTKGFGPMAFCNATVTCPAPPVASSTPVITSSPPVVLSAPVNNQQSVSSANIAQYGIVSALLAIALTSLTLKR